MERMRILPKGWKAYLIDLDGTLYHGPRMIPGSDGLITSLRAKRIPFLFVTNNSSRTPEEVAAHLEAMGISARTEEVCTSAVAAARYIAQAQPGCKVAAIGEAGLTIALKEAGLQLTLEEPDVVVQGIDRQFTYDTLTRAARWIRGGARYVLTNPDLLLPSQEGLMPGAGTLSAAIQTASGVKPTVIGKPAAPLMDFAIARLGLEASEVAVIGDNLHTDIAAGVNAGCGTILTLTGITTADNLPDYVKSSGVEADLVCRDLDEVRARICGSGE
ncbi:MAG: TIGR01457 family HAD-type hydrolase [Paenibacillus sp.]|uniref:TIGR01457 family HAD-type hydrolase n=1 Tax=Paenibacillus sp. TaxID=58172 RepID=UPI002902EC80|nr:TIGR01457 family HAD-type hydrolase [Paenibacillus sp.]MDU2241767.1 TIGR01457 family HAD-type hydrolase [Paenibacillus sp.]